LKLVVEARGRGTFLRFKDKNARVPPSKGGPKSREKKRGKKRWNIYHMERKMPGETR